MIKVMKDYSKMFAVQSTGKKTSNVDTRESLRFLSANNRMKISDNLKKLLGANEHISYGVAPVYDEEEENVFIGIFASVAVENEEGEIEYPKSSKISKTNEFTDGNICTTTRKLVEEMGIEIDDKHLVFLPAKNEAGEIASFKKEVFGSEVTVYILGFEETEDKQRNTGEKE